MSLIGGDVGTTEEKNVGVGIQALQCLLVFISLYYFPKQAFILQY